ncbi:MAG: ATP-binding cassette domain-containing protein [Brevinematales bacterium]|jgi:ABC-2 type transport system ATP-binding protein
MDSGKNSAVDVLELTKKFDKFTAVDKISFRVKKGEIFGFLGPNGAGKSTTIKMLCGIITPSSGAGHVNGFDIVNEQFNIKKSIGYMSQKFSMYDDLTVVENLEFFGSIYGLSGDKLSMRIEEITGQMEMGDMKKKLMRDLPLGVKQRLALGGAIIHNPGILFLDEPTSGVDPIMRRNFWDLIYGFSEEGKTIFVTTHYMDEAEHCDRIALIIGGKIIALDSPGGLKESLGFDVYKITTDNLIEAFNALSGQDFVREAAIFGADIHILCEKGINAVPGIKAVFKNMKSGNLCIDKIYPSLEDVFVTSVRSAGL